MPNPTEPNEADEATPTTQDIARADALASVDPLLKELWEAEEDGD